MNILVLNGSPKGPNSITLQSMKYLEKIKKDWNFSYFHIAQKLRKLEEDPEEAAKAMENADMLLFSYPVYTFLAPYQMHRFIEIIKDAGVDISGKWGTQFSTSKHFYDVTAHEFMKENMLDMGLKVLPGLSADMEDLLTEKGRKALLSWASITEMRIHSDIYEGGAKRNNTSITRSYERTLREVEKTGKGKVSIVTNAESDDKPLLNMIEDFRSSLEYESVVYNIREFPFSGGCISCFSCAKTGKCIHKDGFDSFLRDEIQNAVSIVYAYRVKNHFTSSAMKCYDDRQFCNGHRAVTAGTPTAYIIAGDLSEEENLRTLIKARASVGGNYLAAVATDEGKTAENIEKAAKALSFAISNKITEPRNFYGVGGNKIFRDLIYEMRGLMKADHAFYKKNGYYGDLPQRHKGKILMMELVGALMSLPGADKKKGMMAKGMLMPYQKVLDSAMISEEDNL